MMKCSLYMSMTDRVTLAEIRVLEYKNAFWYPPEVVGGWKVHTTLMIAWLVTLPLPLVFQFHSQSALTALDVWHCLRLGPFREDADCLKIPCRGRGRCVHTTRGFVCQCEAGFTGDTCEGCLSAAVFIHVIDNVSSLFHQHGCGLLLQMSHVPWCVCWTHCKMAEPIEMTFRMGQTRAHGPRNRVSMGYALAPLGECDWTIVRGGDAALCQITWPVVYVCVLTKLMCLKRKINYR